MHQHKVHGHITSYVENRDKKKVDKSRKVRY